MIQLVSECVDFGFKDIDLDKKYFTFLLDKFMIIGCQHMLSFKTVSNCWFSLTLVLPDFHKQTFYLGFILSLPGLQNLLSVLLGVSRDIITGEKLHKFEFNLEVA